ncbi:hypothetical protein O4160_15310 [Rhodococcus sp. IEGM 1401]|uniref:hypothetical protein n=1 Tax=unclassified Rhodococcus (in: high G+C Gram-positive bacteria) TaxID=192944 RepID=UPI0022B380F7|nr:MULTISPECIES: hypothetical protein [unclassified Rhodococcus (in: high G+C Gram-positive bacteria)]MCX6489386.1 hypothetical protein [Rhodococcus sp. (in: high G+C Gram-positive bacteria)]MCZ4562209.1 hypothetical protein [Rhodococcus sp. IEGM 1401]MDI9922252.1 hypothetical protein [Rhodococcus sp. IEGM 1372]MDV8035265.1 hypothetical protein [Rhodococcus sp. IEGM 1414]
MDSDQIRDREQQRLTEGRELYSDDTGKPRLRRSVAAYLDALGTKEAVKGMTDAGLQQQIELLDELNRTLHDASWEGRFQRMLTFSDSIALAVPINGTAFGSELGMLSDSIATYQFQLAISGRFLRGGISTGDIYADYAHITGPALVEAVVLEEHTAIVPRVLLSDEAIQYALAAGYGSYGREAYTSEWNRTFMVDADGRAFVNYLDTALTAEQDDIGPAEHFLQQHKDVVVAALATYPDPSRIREKYAWVAQYHNAFCAQHLQSDSLQITDPDLTLLEDMFPRPFRPLFEPEPDSADPADTSQ